MSDPRLDVPHFAATEGLGAVHVEFGHLNDDCKLGPTQFGREAVQHGRVSREHRWTFDAECLVLARHHQQQAHVRMSHDVLEAVEPVVAVQVRNRDVAVVKSLDEAGRTTAR